MVGDVPGDHLQQPTKAPLLLLALVPVILLWISRLWLQASRGELDEDPVVYAITDRRSLLMGLLVIAIVLSAL